MADASSSELPDELPVRHYGDPVLRRKARPIAAVTNEIRALAERMVVTMYNQRGVGLAAPQVGRSVRLIIVDTENRDRPPAPDASPGEVLLAARMPLPLINPEILAFSDQVETASEGCLSVPKISADVTRPATVLLRATTLDGETIEIYCGGLLGRCLQHEIDHLDGILFPNRLSSEEHGRIADDLDALEKRTRKRLKAAR
jgi:peptide deformylase